MPGQFNPSQRPQRPGSYWNVVATQRPFVPPSPGSVVALVFVHDWGPLEEVQRFSNFDEFVDVYGDDATQPGYIAVKQAFQGEGVENIAGAGQVIAYRVGGSAAASATDDIPNAAATPVTGITLTARYEGSRGNDLSWEVRASATVGNQELAIFDGATEIEVFDHVEDDLAALVATINDESGWVTATLGTDGTALDIAGPTALSGGNDGASLSGADVTGALDEMGTERFSLFALADIAGTTYSGGATAASVLASLLTWAQTHNANGKRFMSVVGGATDETASTANTRSDSIDDPDFVNLGVGSVDDEDLGILSTSQLAPRAAGILAARGETQSFTFARFAGVELLNGIPDDDVLTATLAGTTVLVRDSYDPAPVRTDKGVTTWTDTSDENRPVSIFREAKFVRTMHLEEIEITEFIEQNVIGKLVMNENTRQLIIGEVRARLDDRANRGILIRDAAQGIPTARVAGSPSDDQDYFDIDIVQDFGRSIERVFNTLRIPVG